MTPVETKSTRTSCAALNAALSFSFIALLTNYFEQGARLIHDYCFECSVIEIIVESLVAATVAAAISFGHTLLVIVAMFWCLTMASVSGYRLIGRSQVDEERVTKTPVLDEGVETSGTDMVELSESLA